MRNILVQKSASTLFTDVCSNLESHFQITLVDEAEMSAALRDVKQRISGIVIFDVSENSQRLCEIARNERFSNPAIPIAIAANESRTFLLPFGSKRFDTTNLSELRVYLQNDITISTLVVEDDEAIREVTDMSLAKYMSVQTAADGIHAIEQINNNKYDLIVLDIMIPGKSGAEVFQHLKENMPDAAVVVVTAYDSDSKEFDFIFGGATAYIKKPYESNRKFRQQCMDALLKKWSTDQSAKLVETRNISHSANEDFRNRMSRYV
ncbi:response regulator [Maritalea sp.]|uniref:response regulator n=1 Tax=Maritalea sp. TaxID=2003361 RepID=UPI003EF102F1